jgi:hypothetical protein
LIENYRILSDFFGYNPNFHDAEIIEVDLDIKKLFLKLTIHVFEITSDIDSNGKYRIQKSCFVDLIFENLLELELGEIDLQNIIFNLDFTKHPRGIKTLIESSCGLNGYILSSKVSFVNLR